jgi:putative membrane protein
MKTALKAALSGAFLFVLAQFASAQDKPSDPQIAHIAYTAGVIDIEAAKLAISKSKNSEVAAFAQSMAKDHEAVNVQALDLVKKLNVTPEDNPTSQALTKAADEKHAELGKLDGAAFDKAYIDNEVAYHKGLLETGLKLFQGHQQHAEHVAASLK